MLFRNRELRRALLGAAAVVVVVAVAAGWLVGRVVWSGSRTEAALVACAAVAVCGLALVALFAAVTGRRYRALARMAERVDEALYDDRAPNLSDMHEGELAILASEVDKALTRLTITAEELAGEKASLADSLADISHQLRTPLTSLGLTLGLARREAGPDAHAQLLGRLRTSEQLLSRVQWLVEALLKLARIDAGAVRLRRTHVDASRLVDAAAAPLAIPFDLADVRLESRVQAGAGFMGDEAWCAEALENVLKNCLEHTPAGGRVRVEATEDAVACRISVSDTGPGIAEADLPHVFERFYRGRAAGATGTGDAAGASEVNPTGVGIGLSLAQSLVTAQDGRITAGNVRDAAGRVTGACFDLTFFKTVV